MLLIKYQYLTEVRKNILNIALHFYDMNDLSILHKFIIFYVLFHIILNVEVHTRFCLNYRYCKI
jgi:hypothetical protein